MTPPSSITKRHLKLPMSERQKNKNTEGRLPIYISHAFSPMLSRICISLLHSQSFPGAHCITESPVVPL